VGLSSAAGGFGMGSEGAALKDLPDVPPVRGVGGQGSCGVFADLGVVSFVQWTGGAGDRVVVGQALGGATFERTLTLDGSDFTATPATERTVRPSNALAYGLASLVFAILAAVLIALYWTYRDK
jgi:hypothetical protein